MSLTSSIDLYGNESSPYFDSQDPVCQFAKTKMGLDKAPLGGDLVAFLHKELKLYKATFCEYLRQEVASKGSKYTPAARGALKKLMEDDVLDSGLCPWSTAVPSFNYTTPFSTSDLAREQTHLYNIHGTLAKNNIIFGIDGQNIGEFDDGMPFTKTYRLLTMEPIGYRSLVYPPDDENHESTDCIKVYGHSLAKAD